MTTGPSPTCVECPACHALPYEPCRVEQPSDKSS
jgi:hypothetical protein